MSLQANRTQLTTLTKDLLRKWEQTKESWQDAKGREFEQKYLGSLESHVNAALHSMEKLDAILAKVRSDCE